TRLKDGKLRNFTTADGLSWRSILSLFEDRAGVIWAGSRRGVDRLVGGRFERFTAVTDTLASLPGQDRDGGIFIGIDPQPVLRFAGDRVDTIPGLPGPWDMLETAGGDLWFAGNGIARIPAGRLLKTRLHDVPPDVEVFSTLDGLARADASGATRTLAQTRDGAIWVATPKGLARIDPARLPVSTEKPVIYLTGLTIGRNTATPTGEVILPPGTSHLEIDFSAVDITSPEKIHLQYRLDDVDREWLDAPHGHAVYSSLPPGPHRLRVRASNRSGVWDRDGVAFTVRQVPFFYQTRWFAAALLLTGVLLVLVLYRLGVQRRHLREVAELKATLAERARIAQDLHDTLLQGFVGVTLQLTAAESALPDQPEVAVETLLRAQQLAGASLREARSRVWDMHEAELAGEDLAAALELLARERTHGSGIAVELTTSGERRRLPGAVEDAAFRIGRESVLNAVRHSGCHRIEIHCAFGPKALHLRVGDDGRGFTPDDAEEAKRKGHFGVSGARDRAAHHGGRYGIEPRPGGGTIVDLELPLRG
ncbi:MAG TPA: histidine kinase, partial [Gemmatimonadales bacterium]|nr:histidine kinase [Gemmatimonadales bacterium]